jgi:sporulation protein YlmC with PRC-barrel domain
MKDQNKTQTHFIPTSQLKLYNVVNDQGEDLGQVQNFIVDMCSMRVAYVLVAFEGFLGLGDKWIPMPFEVLTWVPEKKRFMMDISRKTLEKAPTIAKSEWPDKFLDKLEVRDHASWLENVYGYYNLTPYWVEDNCEPCGTETSRPVMVETVTTYTNPEGCEARNTEQFQPMSAAFRRTSGGPEVKEMKTKTPAKRETHFIPTSRLKSYDVVGEAGEELGQVERIIVDMCSGKVAYLLVGLKGHLNDRWVAVPPDAMTWQPAKNNFVLDVPLKTLEAGPTIPKSDWPDKFLVNLEKEEHARWVEDVYTYYNYTPYWIVVETRSSPN